MVHDEYLLKPRSGCHKRRPLHPRQLSSFTCNNSGHQGGHQTTSRSQGETWSRSERSCKDFSIVWTFLEAVKIRIVQPPRVRQVMVKANNVCIWRSEFGCRTLDQQTVLLTDWSANRLMDAGGGRESNYWCFQKTDCRHLSGAGTRLEIGSCSGKSS